MAAGAVVVSVVTIFLVMLAGRGLISTVTEPWASGVDAPYAPNSAEAEEVDHGTALTLPEADPPEGLPEGPSEEPAEEAELPVETEEWPEPKAGEVAAEAEQDRGPGLPPGAVMGLTINAINLDNAPVYNQESEAALNKGVIHIPETPMPWHERKEKNVYLAGHRLGYAGTPGRMIFYRLPDLQTGDKVLLKGPEGKVYRYAVSQRFVVTPNTAWPVQPVRNRDMLTLQTCVGPGYNQRLIVRADRI